MRSWEEIREMKNRFFNLHVSIDSQPVEIVKLQFIGIAGNWLHFQEVKTKTNHLCSPEQFPSHVMKSFDGVMCYQYSPL